MSRDTTSQLLGSPGLCFGECDSVMAEGDAARAETALAAKAGQLTTLPPAASGISSVTSGKIPAWVDENWTSDAGVNATLSSIFVADHALTKVCEEFLHKGLKRTVDGATDKSKIPGTGRHRQARQVLHQALAAEGV